jgi:hypothetical protein
VLRSHLSLVDNLRRFVAGYADHIALALKVLLEEKHLYQSSQVQEADVAWDTFVGENKDQLTVVLQGRSYAGVAEGWWDAENAPRGMLLPSAPGEVRPENMHPTFSPPTIKVYCPTCQRREPHNGPI